MALRLKYKILHIGLPETLEKLLRDFLDDREGKIKIETFIGEHHNFKCGVPQGSVLAPRLFIICTSDTP